jgi:hypothetical protein
MRQSGIYVPNSTFLPLIYMDNNVVYIINIMRSNNLTPTG